MRAKRRGNSPTENKQNDRPNCCRSFFFQLAAPVSLLIRAGLVLVGLFPFVS